MNTRFLATKVVALGLTAVIVATPASAGELADDRTGDQRIETIAAQAAQSDQVPTETVHAYGYRLPLAELIDINGIAEATGISFEEAVSRYGWQTHFNSIVERLEGAHPDSFAGASSSYNDPWIAFAGSVPDSVADDVAALPVSVRLIGGKPYSQAHLKRVLDHSYQLVYSHPEVANAVGGFDIDTGKITITVQPTRASLPRDTLIDRLRAVLDTPTSSNNLPTVDFNIVRSLPASLDGHLFGGGLITACTAGFGVIHTGGNTGLATADHCAVGRPSVTYTNHNGGGQTTLNRQNQTGEGTSNGDLAWYRGINFHEASNFFYSNWNTVRQVTGVQNPRVGNTACSFGRTSGGGGSQCSIVALLNRCGNGYCGLTLMTGYINANGDSGGPWFFGNTAYGIHHGRVGTSAFTPVQGNLFQSMNVVVMTS